MAEMAKKRRFFCINASGPASVCAVVRRLAPDDGSFDFDVLDRIRIAVVRIPLEDNKIRVLPGGDRSLHAFLVRGIGAMDGGDSQRLVDGDFLIRSPLTSFVIAPGDHALNGHEWFERTRLVVRGARHPDS